MDNLPRKIAIFLILTFALSAATWVPQMRAGEMLQPWILLTMWSPGIAAILTRLITQGNLRGMGWVPRDWRMLVLAYVLPFLYAAPVYLAAWAGGLADFDVQRLAVSDGGSPLAGFAMAMSVGIVFSLISATGEEIGWRGFLVPELAERLSLRRVAIFSGLVWAAWHMPLMITANYHGEGTPVVYSLACFAAMIVGLSFIMAWMTLRSGSLWPAAMLHASHNLIVQSLFDNGFRGPKANWVTSEFGIGLAITVAITAFLLVSRFPARVKTGHEKGAEDRSPAPDSP